MFRNAQSDPKFGRSVSHTNARKEKFPGRRSGLRPFEKNFRNDVPEVPSQKFSCN
jgi:hypothetical protein